MDTRNVAADPAGAPFVNAPAMEGSGALGIVIADGRLRKRTGWRSPLVRAFVYGEEPADSPTLPFGRWKKAS